MDLFGKQKNKNLYFSKSMIGVAVGLVRGQNLLLKDGMLPQQAMDILASWVGKEVGKELIKSQKVSSAMNDQELVAALLKETNLAEDIAVATDASGLKFSITKCNICPKRVGGYDLGGKTSCPVGGMLIGLFSSVRGEIPMWSLQLKPAEKCDITVPQANFK